MRMRLLILGVLAFVTPVVDGQTCAAPVSVAFINSARFEDPKGGIIRLVQAEKLLKMETYELFMGSGSDRAKIQQIGAEDEKLLNDNDADPSATIVKLRADNAKRKALEQAAEADESHGKAFLDKRGMEILSPIQADILVALKEFAAKSCYDTVIDEDDLEGEGGATLLRPDRTNITTKFIEWYNARQKPL